VYTSPGDSRGNGVAERAIESGANTYRVHGGLSVAAWAELYDTTCFCENFLPTSANPDKKSPREMLHGEPQDVSFMRTPGTECVVFIHPKHRRAQEDRGVRGKLVGYSSESRTYRVKPHGSSRIMESAHVTFYEQLPQLGEIVSVSEAEESSDDSVTVTVRTNHPPQQVVQQPQPQLQPQLQQPAVQQADTPTPAPAPGPAVITPQQQQSDQSDHILVPQDLVGFLDPDLTAEGVVVDSTAPASPAPTPPPQQAQSQARARARTPGQRSQIPQPIVQAPAVRRGRSRGVQGDSLQSLS